MPKDQAGFILIGHEIPELESKNCQLNSGNNNKRLNVHVIEN